MKINSISIKNFYSIQDVEINFDKYSGLVIIKGKNLDTGGANGAGKSAIFEAVVWGLFGKTIRKSNEEALVNNKARKHCEVSVVVDNSIRITRGRKPTKLEFEVDEVSLTQPTIVETQGLIEERLNTNYKVFMASMVFGQHNNVDFLGASPDDKRTIIRNFLNLEDMFQKRDKIRGFKSTYNAAVKEKSAVIDEHIRTKTDLDGKLKVIVTDKSKFDYSDTAISLDEILEKEAGLRKLEVMHRDLRNERKILRETSSNIRNLRKSDASSCPTCGATSPVEKEPLRKSESAAEREISKISKKLVKLEKQMEAYDIPLSSSEYSEYLEYKELCSKESTYLELLDDIDRRLVEDDTEKLYNIKLYEIMKFWEKAFSEQGLIRYIIRNILEYFNNKCNTYLAYLTNGQMMIHFNEELDETLTINGKITHYISLSGGEKRKVNLAVMLSLQSLLSFTEKEQSNLIFFDEVAENLDEDGLRGLYILLQELKKDKTVFLITHNKNFKTLLDNADRITIIKKKGVSTLR